MVIRLWYSLLEVETGESEVEDHTLAYIANTRSVWIYKTLPHGVGGAHQIVVCIQKKCFLKCLILE